MSCRSKRWLSILVLGTLAFAQLNLALAACAMDRGQLAQMLSQPAGHECCDEAMAPAHADDMSITPKVSIGYAPLVGVLILPLRTSNAVVASRGSAPPPNPIPSRILLHSFLI